MSQLTVDGEEKLTCSIITQDAVGPVSEVHTRMPIALPVETHAEWLDPTLKDPSAAITLARERAVLRFEHFAVSPRVNIAKNDGADLIAPLTVV
jgi:putative SOS response-associated peptidase YedK